MLRRSARLFCAALDSKRAFQSLADTTLTRVEKFLCERGVDELETTSDGVLSFVCDTSSSSSSSSSSTFVLNKQSAAQELWLSSPLSGPWHFRMIPLSPDARGVTGAWVCTRDTTVTLRDVLRKDLVPIVTQQVSDFDAL